MDVAAEVVEQMLGRAERLFGVDVPTFFSQSFEQGLKLAGSARGEVLPRKMSFCCSKAFPRKSRNLPWKTILSAFTEKRKFLRAGIQRV